VKIIDMRIALISSESLFETLNKRFENIDWIRMNGLDDWKGINDADALFVFQENAMSLDFSKIKIPVVVNGVVDTLKTKKHPDHVVRINAWPGFLDRTLWEASGKPTEFHATFETTAAIKFIWLPDEPGFVTPRAIAMIVNEAYFAKEAGVSQEADIDIALQLGTNYPHGPFEWGKKIGIDCIHNLLKKLSTHDKRYTPCALLEKEADA
jgi:3-hydroxybutyryl-CoA dehydrogenase